MKVKIKKANNEIKVEYFKTKNMHKFRYDVLNKMVNLAKTGAVLFIDTNSGAKKFTFEQIKDILDKYQMTYLAEPTKKAKKSMFGTGFSIKRRKAAAAVEESIALIQVDNKNISQEFYNEFLQYFDYAIGIDSEKTIEQLIETYRLNCFDVLFNKELLPICIYDSILIGSFRIDENDMNIENLIKEAIKRKDQ